MKYKENAPGIASDNKQFLAYLPPEYLENLDKLTTILMYPSRAEHLRCVLMPYIDEEMSKVLAFERKKERQAKKAASNG